MNYGYDAMLLEGMDGTVALDACGACLGNGAYPVLASGSKAKCAWCMGTGKRMTAEELRAWQPDELAAQENRSGA